MELEPAMPFAKTTSGRDLSRFQDHEGREIHMTDMDADMHANQWPIVCFLSPLITYMQVAV
ncbi:hypothetical protein PspKH34_13690 [Parageobacillus sp. KH3-4]|nr:hypothetical protein PspKH34_13690 [Parageobacillus sp. KH3-4]